MKIFSLIFLFSLISACVAAPVEEQSSSRVYEKGALVLNPNGSSYSTESIKKQKEQKYLQLLNELNNKNPRNDAQQVLNSGNIYVLGYQAGRGQFNIPSINPQDNRCAVKQIEGMGDTIYGKNHLKYRVAVNNYASQFNQIVSHYCQ